MRCQVTRGRLLAALKATAPFLCEDEYRTQLGCLALVAEEVDGVPTLAFVATEGHALTVARIQVADAKFGSEAEQILIRRADVKVLIKALAHRKSEAGFPVEVSINGNPAQVQFEIHGGTCLRYTAPDETYPEWRRVLPPALQADTAKRPTLIALSPVYLALAGAACEDFAKQYDKAVVGFSISVPETKNDAVRLDFRHPDCGELTCVIMPMHL